MQIQTLKQNLVIQPLNALTKQVKIYAPTPDDLHHSIHNFTPYQSLQIQKTMKQEHGSGSASAVYGLGFIGAAVYFISTATGFWIGVLGVLKAIVWPAILVYEALKTLGA
jgi:hypothetical protein